MRILTILALLVLLTASAFAEDRGPEGPRNAVLIDLLYPAIGWLDWALKLSYDEHANYTIVRLAYQRQLSDHFVLAVRPAYRFESNYDGGDASYSEVFEPRLGGELQWHPFGAGLKGPFLGAQLDAAWRYENPIVSGGDRHSKIDLDLGPTFGWQFLLPRNLILALGAGISYGPVLSFQAGESTPETSWWIDYQGEIALGIRF